MSAHFSHSIDEDLIAAYVDGDVTAEERLQVERAMAASEQVAWEVESLRRTVDLLHDLPKAALPRSFVLAESQVEDVLQARRARSNPFPTSGIQAPPAENPWQRIFNFLAGGNPLYRNAAMAAAALLLIVVAADISLPQPQVGTLATGSDQQPAQTSTPQIQVTLVGGTASTGGGSGTAVREEQDNGDIGIMSTGESPSEMDSEEISTLATSTTGDQSATKVSEATPQPTQPSVVSTPPVSFEPPETENTWYSLRSLLRSARIVLVLAIIVLWLLSRRRPRTSSA